MTLLIINTLIMSKIITTAKSGMMSKVLEWTYEKAVNGFGGIESAYQLGEDYLKAKGTLDKQVDQLIKWQVTKAASTGFVTGLGGLSLMAVSLPANLVSVIYIQIRMISAIAHMGGHDIQSDQVKSLIYVCMLGNGTKEVLKEMGIKAGKNLTKNVIEHVSAKLASKFGGKTLVGFGKAIPLVGGVIGGSFDGGTTFIAGKIAKKMFIDNYNSTSNMEIEDGIFPSVI